MPLDLQNNSFRCAITGMGIVSPLGNNIATFRDNLFNGVSGISGVEFPFRGETIKFPAAPVVNFDPGNVIDPKKLNLLDRFAQFAVVAAKQALDDAGIEVTPQNSRRIAVIIGTGVGGQNTLEESYTRLLTTDTPRVHPFTIPRLMANAGSSQISMHLGLHGVAFTVASACASALHAMGIARLILQAGLADYVVTGGAESCLTFGTLKGWAALRVMAPDVPRPFSINRNGMVIGEGAGILVLEREEFAQQRGARIYARLAGIGMNADAQDLTSPDVNRTAEVINMALADAGVAPSEVDHVNAHGTGTKINDEIETASLHLALGSDIARRVAVSANKSQFGHALGAASALEMIATVMSVNEDRAPPTIGWLGRDPNCDLDVVATVQRPMPIRVALKNAFAFGGLNASAVLIKAC